MGSPHSQNVNYGHCSIIERSNYYQEQIEIRPNNSLKK